MGLEVCNRYETDVINTAADALRLADDIGADNVLVHLDFVPFFRALDAIDYTGPITFESFSSAVVAQGLSNNLAIWRNLWSDGADLARHAHQFISEQLYLNRVAARVGLRTAERAMNPIVDELCGRIDELVRQRRGERVLGGIVGLPGSGKTTLAEAPVAALLERLRHSDDDVWAPAFDRTIEQPIAGSIPVLRHTEW